MNCGSKLTDVSAASAAGRSGPPEGWHDWEGLHGHQRLDLYVTT